MLHFRSEAHIEVWCEQTQTQRGEVVPLDQVWQLSKLWYHNRMHPAYRGRSAQEAEAVFVEAGLTSAFWKFS